MDTCGSKVPGRRRRARRERVGTGTSARAVGRWARSRGFPARRSRCRASRPHRSGPGPTRGPWRTWMAAAVSSSGRNRRLLRGSTEWRRLDSGGRRSIRSARVCCAPAPCFRRLERAVADRAAWTLLCRPEPRCPRPGRVPRPGRAARAPRRRVEPARRLAAQPGPRVPRLVAQQRHNSGHTHGPHPWHGVGPAPAGANAQRAPGAHERLCRARTGIACAPGKAPGSHAAQQAQEGASRALRARSRARLVPTRVRTGRPSH